MKTSRYPRKYLLISKPAMEIVISNIEKWTFEGMCEVYYRAKGDKKEATCL